MSRTATQVALRFNIAPLDRDPMREVLRKQLRLLASLLQFRQVPGTEHCVIDRDEIQSAILEIQRVMERS